MKTLLTQLQDTARYAGLLLGPAEDFGQGFFCPSGKKKGLIMLFWTIFCNFWCPVVTLVTFSSNLSNFEKNPKKKPKKYKTNPKNSNNSKNSKIPKKNQEMQKI